MYEFAFNKTKLAQSIKELKDKQALNPLIQVDQSEEAVKEVYIRRAGLVQEFTPEEKKEMEKPVEVIKPKVFSNAKRPK